MATRAQIILGREIERGVKAGDIPSQQGERITRALTVEAMTPAERALYYQRKQETEALDRIRAGRVNMFKAGNDRPPAWVRPGENKTAEFLRELSLGDDWLAFFRVIYPRDFGHVRTPQYGRTYPVGKYRFNWGLGGTPRYVPFTKQSLLNYFTHPQAGRWITTTPFTYKCPASWFEEAAEQLYQRQVEAQQRYPDTDYRHVLQFTPSELVCTKPEKSLWVKIRKPLLIAAAIVAAVYLGPLVVDKIGAALPTGGGATAGTTAGATSEAAAQASFFAKVKSGANTVLGYVNKARTVNAIVHGELPPPPVGITGSNFREWAMIVAKDQLKQQAIEMATEAGVEYVQREMTKREEAKLRAEIEQMQRELAALIPESTPMTPAPGVPDQVQTVMVDEKDSARALNNTLGLAIPAGLAFLMLQG